MPKYTALTTDQLQSLEKEFVDFLVLNGITSEDWVKMKATDAEAATEMTELFSDVVWEGILRKAKYLCHSSAGSIKCFQCLPDQMVLVGMDSSTVDLLTELHQVTNGPRASEVEVYTTTKAYSTTREQELFTMIKQGCEISDGELFKALCLLL